MAGQTINSVTSAVTGELTSRVFSGLIQRYGKDAATSEKLQRLEMLIIKIQSAVEASEKRTIENSWLLRWRDKLKDAASQGDEVLASFLQWAKDAQSSSNTNIDNLQQGEAVSSSASAPATDVGVLSFKRNSLSGMVQGICKVRNILFTRADDGMERLNRTLGSLEKLSSDIGEFVRLLHLEALPKVDQTPHSTAPSTEAYEPTEKMGETREKKRTKHSIKHSNPISEPKSLTEPPREEEETDLYSCFLRVKTRLLPYQGYSMFLPKERQFMLLQDRLEAAFTEICKAVELADSHDLEGLEWLSRWAGILREVKEQGRDVLGTTSACKTVNTDDNKEPIVESDQDEDELASLVHRLEGLARDVEYFSKLVYLCAAR